MGDDRVLSWMLSPAGRGALAETADYARWKGLYDRHAARWPLPVDRALAGGYLSDRAAFAFAAGYLNAVLRLIPAVPPEGVAAFCVTEDEGGHPRAVKTAIEDGAGPDGEARVRGRKKFVTLAGEATHLVLACSRGAGPDGMNRLVMVLVERSAPGVSVKVMEGIPFVPEISHGALEIDTLVPASAVLPGDGYADYVRPFRTVEDIHVQAAVMGYLLGASFRYSWPRETAEEIASVACALRELAAGPFDDPALHVALAGVTGQVERTAEKFGPHWALVEDGARERWERDRRLLSVGGQARAKRTITAWEKLSRKVSGE